MRRLGPGLVVGLILVLGLVALWWLEPRSPSEPPASSPVDAELPPPGYSLRFHACDSGRVPGAARCAELLTPEYDTVDGPRRFRLPVIVLRYFGSDRRPDPVIYLPGGPGASPGLDAGNLEFWRDWQGYANLRRDLILMDRRGVGLSQPALDCEAYDEISRKVVGQAISMAEESERTAEVLRRCFERLESEGAFRTDQFGTRVSARDLGALMRELDYEQYNLVGVSYGTRLAMAATALPQVRSRMQSLVLDSVYPPDKGGLVDWPGEVTRGMERFLRWCAEKDNCAPGVDSIDRALAEALASLEEEPMRLTVDGPQGEPIDVSLTDYRFFTAAFGALYDHTRWPDLVRAIKAIPEREKDGVRPLVGRFIRNAFSPQFSSLTFMSVDCLDHTAPTREAYEAALEKHARFSDYFWHWDNDVCHWLGHAERPLPSLKVPDVPTLILAGELDPVTPAHWADELAAQWPEAQLHRADGIGHSVLWSDRCAEAALGRFLDNPEEPWRAECRENFGDRKSD